MNTHPRLILCALALTTSAANIAPSTAQQPATPERRVIVSQSHPNDSRGEVVFDEQESPPKDATVVPGILVHPEVLKKSKPKVPSSARAHHRKISILIEGVVTPKGDVIDAQIREDDGEPELAKNCLEACSKYRFKPATLDGKTVAVLLKEPFSFDAF